MGRSGMLFVLYIQVQSGTIDKVDVQWKREWFGKTFKGFWMHKRNQIEFFNSLAKKFGIEKPNDWGNVHNEDILATAGGAAILGHFDSSLFKALQNVYSGILVPKLIFL